MFSKKQIWSLLIPLMIEQVLTSLMGTVDTMMVATAGSAAISAVSLVDTINVLIIFIFTAMASGGTIVCAQYLGRGERTKANEAGNQLVLSTFLISVAITVIFVLFRGKILSIIFGTVEADVMREAMIYLLITVLSYPFIALYNAGAALFRVDGNSRLPMKISTISNIINVAGNALMIFGFHLGVAGAAMATLFSRIICGIAIMIYLRYPGHSIIVRNYFAIRPNREQITRIMKVGIPSGIENGMFQFGKLAIQSCISTLGTVAIAGHAMAASVEMLTSNAQMGIGIGMMNIVGLCIGAGRIDEARKYIKQLTFYAEIVTIIVSLIFAILIRPITIAARMEPAAADLAVHMIYIISIVKIFPWTLAYIPAHGLRAAGDVRYTMLVSTLVMWICRVAATIFMIRVLHWGIMAAWYGMFLDWFVKGAFMYGRFLSGRWIGHNVIETAKN